MAMITCPNCGEKISDKAKSCCALWSIFTARGEEDLWRVWNGIRRRHGNMSGLWMSRRKK